jgi:hypothetical protein
MADNDTLFVLIKILNNVMLISDNNISTIIPTIVSSDIAAESQLAFSKVYKYAIKYNLDPKDVESIVNEVSLTKLAISNKDPRVIKLKNQIIMVNNSLPENIRFTNDQFNSFLPVLAPF